MASNVAENLLSELASGKSGLAKRVFAYLSPLLKPNAQYLSPLLRPNAQHKKVPQYKNFSPFITEALKILPEKLAQHHKANEEVSKEWFLAYNFCLSGLESTDQVKGPLLPVGHRFNLLLSYVEWKHWKEGESEALTIFKKLKPSNCKNLYLPDFDPKAKYTTILAKTVGLFCMCVARYKPKHPDHYIRIPQIVNEFQPWASVLHTDVWQLVHESLMTGLLTITSYLVGQFGQLDIARKLCDVIITTPMQGSHCLTKLCDSLYQIGMQLDNNKDLKQASDAFRLHCKVTWDIIEAKLKNAETDSSLVFFGKWCEGVRSLIQVLTNSESTPLQLQGLIKGWTDKWTAEGFCTTLPGPIPLVEQWVKIQVEFTKRDDNGVDADAGILLGNVSTSLSKAARKKILQQELVFYVQMQNENHNFCKRMQTMISNLLQEDGFDKAKYWLEESSSLILCGIKGLNYCIQYLSQAVEVSDDHELALAYALRSLCTDEYEPNSEEVIKDIRSALSVWSSIITAGSSMETENLMNILNSILDLLSLKGRVDLNCCICNVMIEIYTRRGVSLKILLAKLWETRRFSHALCPSPVQEAFINLQEHFGEELKFTKFWIPLAPGFVNNFSTLKSNIQADDVEEIASKLISSDTESGIYSASCIYYDLSENMISNVHSIEALWYAKNAHRLREKLFRKKCPWSSGGRGGGDNETGRHMLINRLSVSQLWSVDTDFCVLDTSYISPWKAIQGYLESILQLGIIHEILGNANKAEYFLNQGKKLSCSRGLTMFNIVFSSYLGELYLKKQCWLFAEKELQSASKLLKDIKIDDICSKCISVLEVKVTNSLGFLYQNNGTSLGRLPTTNLYREALANLYTSEWKRSITCYEDQDVNLVLQDDSIECCQNKVNWDVDLRNCVVSVGNGVPCICAAKGCWHCVTEKFTRSGLVTDAIKLKWELVHRRLSHKLLTGLGKYLENDCQIHEACEILLQSISVIVGSSPFCRASKSTFLPDTLGEAISAQRKHLNLYHLLGREIEGDALCLERAIVLFNLCWLSLMERKKDPRNNPHVLIDIPISKLVSWLMLAFVLSREVPAVFQKVSRLLAAIFSLSTSSVLEASLSTSCQDLCGRHWVSFFHQASLGVQFNYQFFIKEVQQHEDTKVSHMASGLQKLPRLAPKSVLNLFDFVNGFFGGLPSTTVICLSILGGSYSSVFQELLSCSSAPAWMMVSRLNHNTLPIHIVLPVHLVLVDGVMRSVKNDGFQWRCPWGFTVVDDVVPSFRSLMEDISYLSEPSLSADRQLEMIQRIDGGLRQLMNNIEDSWFGSIFKYVLLGEVVNCKDIDTLCEDLVRDFGDVDLSTLKVIMLGLLKYGHEGTTSIHVLKFFLKKGCFFNDAQDVHCPDVMHDFASKIHKAAEKLKKGFIRNKSKPIILIPDFDVQMLPWENLPILRKQEVYRMPSVGSLLIACRNERKINPLLAYYVLNPDGSLSTDNCNFQKLFKDNKLKGKDKCEPEADELVKALESRDLFIYIGHGSGSKYIPNGMMEGLQNIAGAILCGCRSAALTLDGLYIPQGPPLAYLLAGSPFIFGYLWNVIATEAEKSTHAILASWFEGRCDRSLNLARIQCSKFPYLVGAALVCYGVPPNFKGTTE